jgi:hypothetical protein
VTGHLLCKIWTPNLGSKQGQIIGRERGERREETAAAGSPYGGAGSGVRIPPHRHKAAFTGCAARYHARGPFSGARPQCALDTPRLLLDPLLLLLAAPSWSGKREERRGARHSDPVFRVLHPPPAISARLVSRSSDFCGASTRDFSFGVGILLPGLLQLFSALRTS